MLSPNPALAAQAAVLGCYLAHGIDVESTAWGRGRLLGLPWSQRWERPQAEVAFEYPTDQTAGGVVQVCEVKPVLYGFEDLTATINGVVPAEAIARALNYSENAILEDRYTAFALNGEVNIHWHEVEQDAGGETVAIYECLMTIESDWSAYMTTEDGREGVGAKLVDVARANHFAVGLSPEQYIRKELAHV